jgi:hypothetical protein
MAETPTRFVRCIGNGPQKLRDKVFMKLWTCDLTEGIVTEQKIDIPYRSYLKTKYIF